MDLSPLDLRILRYSLENGVLESEREIAKKLRINPSTLSFKMRKFEDKKIITNYKYRVDFTKIGFKQIAWVLIMPKFEGKRIREMMDCLLEYPQVHVCLNISGKHGFCIKIYSENKKEITELLEKIQAENKWIKIHKPLFVSKQVKSHNQIVERKNNYKLDEIALKLLAEKMQNPQERLSDAAKKINIHRNTASAKWKEMLENKIIVKKTPIINPDLHRQMGIYFMVVQYIRSVDRTDKLEKLLEKMSEVHELNCISRDKDYNLLAIIRTKDIHEYYTLMDKFYNEKEFSNNIEKMSSTVIISSDSRRHTYLKDIGIQKLVKNS